MKDRKSAISHCRISLLMLMVWFGLLWKNCPGGCTLFVGTMNTCDGLESAEKMV